MTVPLLSPVTLAGFADPWWSLFLLVPLALVGLYVAVLVRKCRRVLRFATWNCSSRWPGADHSAGATSRLC